MHLPPLDMLREPPSLSPDERSPLWSPDSGPVTPADGVQVYFAAKDLVPSPDNEDADRANAPESRRILPSERDIKGRAKSMLFQLNKSVSALSLRSGAGSTKSGVFLPVELQERQASSSASPLGVGCHSLQSTQPGPTSSNFGRSNFMRSFAAFPPPPYLSERNDVSTPATAPATPPSSSSHSRVNDGAKAAGDFQLGEDKGAQGQFQDTSQQPASDAKGTVTLSPSALAFPGDLALDFKLPSTGTSAPGSAPPANPTIRPNPSSPSNTPIMHASFVSPSIVDFRTPDATMAHPEKTAGLELLFQDDFSSASASASAGMDLPLDVRCSPTPPPTVHQNADVVSEVAVIGREDAGEIPEEVEVVVEQESTIVDRTPSFPMNNRRLSSSVMRP
ncbi:hypothetical protein OF83DRAFT_1176713 [Amylostereum chailletii]|nr:hypothetical protein OF83DRAFT_1176713 [Amylostereum chailletii]